jgi:hypothetical protein
MQTAPCTLSVNNEPLLHYEIADEAYLYCTTSRITRLIRPPESFATIIAEAMQIW